MRIPKAICAALLALNVTGCQSTPRESIKQRGREMLRDMAQINLAGRMADCLHHHLSQAQREYVFSRTTSNYTAQRYLHAMATGEDAACQDRALRDCEEVSPGECLAQPGELYGKLASTEP